MKEQENNFTLYSELRMTMLQFAEVLSMSKNSFFKELSIYLKNEYEREQRMRGSASSPLMESIDEFLSFVWLLPQYNKGDVKGYALLGKTPFDKYNLVKSFLECYGGKEFADDGITKNRYVVIDCEEKIEKSDDLLCIAVKYKDIPFVIFNNCDEILTDVDNLRHFKTLCKGTREFTHYEDVEIKSWYILLGNENKLKEIKKLSGDEYFEIKDRIYRFEPYIEIIDIDDISVPLTEEDLEQIKKGNFTIDN